MTTLIQQDIQKSGRLLAFQPPPHWRVTPLGYLFESVGGATPSKENEEYWSGKIPWVSPKDMKSDVITGSEDHISEAALNETRLALLPASTILVVVRGMILVHTIPIAVTAIETTINQDMKGLFLKKGVTPEYFALLLRSVSSALFSTIEESGHGTRCLRLDLWRNILVGVPPEDEQQLIVQFVEEQSVHLDALIAKKQKMIDLLHEKRQALISEVVTKGLDPDVPMQNSSLSGLGMVPLHWEKSRVKHLISFITSGSRGWAEHYSDEGDLFVQSGNLGRRMELDFRNIQRVTPPSGAETLRTIVNKDDVLVCVTGAYTGNVVHVAEEIERAFVNQHVALVRPDPRKVRPRFLAYLLHSSFGQSQLLMTQFGGIKQGLGLDDVRESVSFIPPLAEQGEIIRFLDKHCQHCERGVLLLKAQIERLREYRLTLISDAVTGKSDLTGVLP